jgi:pimeloyl-ACP methyl ester carboxylesterase
MILLGHAFGGFLSCAYSLKYPQYTKALILVDPWGFPEYTGNLSKQDTPTPIWIQFVTNFSRFVSPLSMLRATGNIGVSLFKYFRPDFKRKFANVCGSNNSDLIYEYLFYCNKENPRYVESVQYL